MTTLKSKTVSLTNEGGTTWDAVVNQIKLKQYEECFKHYENETEFIKAATGVVTEDLLPESYEVLVQAVEEVNEGGFFVYAARRSERMMARLTKASPALLKAVADRVSPSTASVPGLQPK